MRDTYSCLLPQLLLVILMSSPAIPPHSCGGRLKQEREREREHSEWREIKNGRNTPFLRPARTGAPAPAVAWTAYPSAEPSEGRVTDRECDGGDGDCDGGDGDCDGGAGGMTATAPMAVEMIPGAGCSCCSTGWLLLLD